MAQTNTLGRELVSWAGEETTFSTAPAGAFPNAYAALLLPQDGLLVDGLTHEMLDNPDAHVRRLDLNDKIIGLKKGSKASLKCQVKPLLAASLLTGATAVGNLSHRLLYRHAFGAEYAGVGGDISAGTSTTVFTVANAVGATLRKGTIIGVSSNGTAVPEPCRVDNLVVAADTTVTVSPPLSFTPDATSKIRQAYSYAPAETKTNTLALRRAFVGDANAQWQMLGCRGPVKIELPEFGKIATITGDLTCNTHTGPTAAGYAVTAQAEDMGAPAVWRPSVYLVKRPSAATRAVIARATRFVCESLALDMPAAFEEIREGGATETVLSVIDTSPGPYKVTIKQRFDGDATDGPNAYYEAGTELELFAICQCGGTTMTTAPFLVLDAPRCKIMDPPKPALVGSRMGWEYTLTCYPDDTVNATAGSAPLLGAEGDFRLAPIRWALL